MKSVYFFQCQEAYGSSIYLPYSAGILWCYLNQFNEIKDNYTLKKVFFEKIPYSSHLEKIINPDICLFSNYGWNTTYQLQIAKIIKDLYPNCQIIVGGPNSRQDEDYIRQHSYVDIWIWGEGEETLRELLTNKPLVTINGIAYLLNDNYYKNPIRERRKYLDEIPSPYLTGFFDSFFNDYDYNFLPIWETDRGCPYACTFCDQGSEYFTKLYQFDINRLYKEIDWFANKKIEYVELTASNFGIFERDLDIVKYIKELHDNTGYPQKINATWAKNSPERVFKMSKILEKINRGGVTLALQSSNQTALDNIKRFNIVNDKLEKITNRYINSGILTYHDFIIGLPGETLASWKEGLLYVIDMNPEGWIFGHAMEAFFNTEFKDPNYIKKYKLQFAHVPQVSFYNFKKEGIPVEMGDYVIGSYSMTTDDFIEALVFKYFIVTYYCLGWVKHIADTLHKENNVKRSDFFIKLYEWSNQNNCIIKIECDIVRNNVKNVLKNKDFWGRQVHGSNDIYWEYETGSSCFIEKDRKNFYMQLEQFLSKTFPYCKSKELVKYADLKQISFSRKYPCVVDNYKLNAINYETFEEFCKNVYWYGKKKQGWKVNILEMNE
jgi:radical SAM superfamily enzyme YgiQ (UPF0313 family)